MSLKQKIILFGGGGLLLVLMLVLVSVSSGPPGSVAVEVIVLPEDSNLTLNDQPAKAGRHVLTKGTHTFKASRQDFAEATKVVDTNDLTPDQKIYIMPSPNSDKAIQYLLDHPEIQEKREEGGATDAKVEQNQLEEKYPFLGSLPYETIDYKIDYALDKDNKLSFVVTLYPSAIPNNPAYYKQQLKEFKEESREWFVENSVVMADYKITYTPDPDALQ